MGNLVSVFLGLASALLAIFLTPVLQHYFWRRQRHAELCLPLIDRCAELIIVLEESLVKIQREKRRTDADADLIRRWDALGLEIGLVFDANKPPSVRTQ